MKIYHGTCGDRLKLIEADGEIRPRGTRTSNWRKHPSHPGAVYLTSVYAPYFAVSAVDGKRLKAGIPGVTLALLEIDADRLEALVPDEDAVEQAMRDWRRRLSKEALRKRTAHARALLPLHLGTGDWELSLQLMGTCAHLGPIPLSAVTRIATIDMLAVPQWVLAAMDAMPGIRGYRLAGDTHRELTRLAFSGQLPGTVVKGVDRP